MAIKTYNPKQVTISLGTHLVTGYAEDSFVAIEASGDGVSKKVGCDGEIVRAIGPDDTYAIKLSLLQTSKTNKWLQKKFTKDQTSGNGMFSVLINDLKGNVEFSASYAWVAKPAGRGWGKDSNNREREIHTRYGTYTES